MKKLLMSLATFGLIAAPIWLLAHEGHKHTVLGTVERVEKTQLDVKDTDGNTESFVLTDETKVLRGKKVAPVSSLTKGERVAVESEEKGGARVAVTVRVGGGETTQTYFCPMHPEVTSDGPGRCSECGMFLQSKETEQ